LLGFNHKTWINWFWLSLLIVSCWTGLKGCTGDRLPSQPNSLQGTLILWHSLDRGFAESLKVGVERFKQINPGVNIQIEYFSPNQISPRFIKLAQKGLGASAIVTISRNIPELVDKGVLKPLTPQEIDLNLFSAKVFEQLHYRDNIYAVPLVSQTKVLCYNQAKIAASEDPILRQPPTSLGGLLERAAKGYSVGMISSFEDTLWGLGVFGGSLFDKQGKLNPQFGKWAIWIDWLKKATLQPNFVLLRADRSVLHKAFAQGQLTYYVCNAEEIIDLKTAMKQDLRVALLPREPTTHATPLLYTQTMLINGNASPNEVLLAVALANFLTNPEQQLRGVVQTQSFIPTNRNVIISDELSPLGAILVEQAKTAIAIPLDEIDRILPLFELGETLYQQAIAGTIESGQAAKQLEQMGLSPRSSPGD
jgi:arabinogalactan oligomer/maltooligosaccharide transport system substrate-binding protein